jgi:hypothetical protein
MDGIKAFEPIKPDDGDYTFNEATWNVLNDPDKEYESFATVDDLMADLNS